MALSLKGSQQPLTRQTASQPNAKAVLISVPRLPGSCTPSRMRSLLTSALQLVSRSCTGMQVVLRG
jgi:hypothetical protein